MKDPFTIMVTMKEGIKTLLKSSGVSLKEVADELDVSIATISRALDDKLILKVQNTSLNLIEKRNREVSEHLESLKHE